METILTSREFTKICKSYGFKKEKNKYTRCLGDGIFQIIDTGARYYMSIESPYYSPKNQKSNAINFDCYSMYAELPEYFFEAERGCAGFRPENLYGQRMPHVPFIGIQDDYKKMLDKGFDFLNSIRTQQDLINGMELVANAEHGGILPHWTKFCAPYLICGRPKDALHLIAGRYIQNWNAFHCNFDSWISKGKYDEYFSRANELQTELATHVDLYFRILQNDEKKIKEYLFRNYQRNMSYAEKNHIPFSDDYSPLF